MKYFTSQIPLPLAEKLKEKGMPMDTIENFAGTGKDITLAPTFASCFDWLMNKGRTVYMLRVNDKDLWHSMVATELYEGTWHEAAEVAIEKALTLI